MKLKFYFLILSMLIIGGKVAFAQLDPPCTIPGAYVCDNFDAYTVGDYVGPGASWWTTWDGIESSPTDGVISDEQAYSGTNSMLIQEGASNDQLLLLGNQTSGTWILQWMCYIPEGKTAYYNIQESEFPGVAWNLEVLYGLIALGVPGTSGEGVISIPFGGAAFEYPQDTWFLVQQIIDLDAGTIELYINDVFIYSDFYLGTSIGAIDFYSVDDNNRYYIDDVLLIDASLAVTYYLDSDGDGFGDSESTISVAGGAPTGYVSDSTDCNDLNVDVNPGETEICNGIDDNCAGGIDEGVLLTFYADSDGDGYGNFDISVTGCEAPDNYVAENTDCDDTNGDVYPGATEVENGIDDDCDNVIDEGFNAVENADASAMLSVYPVPATDHITLQLTNTNIADQITGVDIYTASGQLIYSDAAMHILQTDINCSDYASGIYVCKITTKTAVIYRQITIQKD